MGLIEPLEELRELASVAGARIVGEIHQHRERPDPAFFIGKGKATLLRDEALLRDADLVIFDEELNPAQMENLQRLLELKVVDRTGLILDIFSRRARTREGKLQVELAQLNYRLSHLSGRGDWLSRLGAGIGTRGPGETQLEVDRRRIRARMAKLRSELEQVRQHRRLHRTRRKRNNILMVSLVGYTNAGKSTLFERLSGENADISGRVFSTLDTIVRRVHLADGCDALLSDTVGFIRKLPHELVTAFRATLEEVEAADLILHVVDASASDYREKIRTVQDVLRDLGCAEHLQLVVFNKCDLPHETTDIDACSVVVSALTGEGIRELRARILKLLREAPDRVLAGGAGRASR